MNEGEGHSSPDSPSSISRRACTPEQQRVKREIHNSVPSTVRILRARELPVPGGFQKPPGLPACQPMCGLVVSSRTVSAASLCYKREILEIGLLSEMQQMRRVLNRLDQIRFRCLGRE